MARERKCIFLFGFGLYAIRMGPFIVAFATTDGCQFTFKEQTSHNPDYGRQDDTRTEESLHEGGEGERHKAGNDGKALSLLPRAAFPCQQPPSSGLSRHCVEEIQDSGVYRRLLLAWP